MSLLFNMLSRLVIAFLPRSKRLLISQLQSPSAVILESPKIKSVTVSTVSPSICHEVMGPDAMILVLWVLSCKLTLSWLNHLPKAPPLNTITLQHMNLWVRHIPSVHSTYAIKGKRHMLSWVSCHSDWFTSSEVFHKKVVDAGSSHHTTLLLTSALSV